MWEEYVCRVDADVVCGRRRVLVVDADWEQTLLGEVDVAWLRDQMAVVSQVPTLFDASVEESTIWIRGGWYLGGEGYDTVLGGGMCSNQLVVIHQILIAFLACFVHRILLSLSSPSTSDSHLRTTLRASETSASQ